MHYLVCIKILNSTGIKKVLQIKQGTKEVTCLHTSQVLAACSLVTHLHDPLCESHSFPCISKASCILHTHTQAHNDGGQK
jgi:hypothetical protein